MLTKNSTKIIPLYVCLTLAACSNDKQVNNQPNTVEPAQPDTTTEITVLLSGAEQVPQTFSQYEVNAVLTFDETHQTLQGELQLNGMSATAAHIHQGFAGESGAVIAAFETTSDNNILMLPEVNLNEEQTLLLRNGQLYINVHSEAFPNGEQRGQVLLEGTSVKVFPLTGWQVSPTVTTPASGTGYLTVNDNENSINLLTFYENIDSAFAAHLHQGQPGENGPALINLTMESEGVHQFTSGLVEVEQSFIDLINDDRMYVNVHSEAHQNGEIRGQVLQEGTQINSFVMNGLQLEPPIGNDYSSHGFVKITPATGDLSVYVQYEFFSEASSLNVTSISDSALNLMLEMNGANQFTLDVSLSEAQMTDYLAGNWKITWQENEHPVASGVMLASPLQTQLFLDRESLLAGVNNFEIFYQGQKMGSASIETLIDEDIVKIVEITDAPPFGVVETLSVEIDIASGAPLRYSGTGTSGERQINIDLTWNNNLLTGSTDLQDAPIATRLPATHMEQLGLFYTLQALPLALGLEYPLALYNGLDNTLTQRVVQVTGIEQVSVAAGTFETFRVFLGGSDQVNQIFYITTESPHRLIQIGFDAFPITYELQQ